MHKLNLFIYQVNLRSQYYFNANLEVIIFNSSSSHLYAPVLTANNLLAVKFALLFVSASEVNCLFKGSTDSPLFLQKYKEFEAASHWP